jgi:hypothetical protein
MAVSVGRGDGEGERMEGNIRKRGSKAKSKRKMLGGF